jgi:hypothetical protein
LDVLANARCRGGSLFIPLPSDRQDFTGDLTYYDSTGLGACGQVLTDDDPIVAVSHYLYDAVAVGTNPNDNPLCGLKIRAERFDEQVNAMRSVDLTVADRCGYLPFGSMRTECSNLSEVLAASRKISMSARPCFRRWRIRF